MQVGIAFLSQCAQGLRVAGAGQYHDGHAHQILHLARLVSAGDIDDLWLETVIPLRVGIRRLSLLGQGQPRRGKISFLSLQVFKYTVQAEGRLDSQLQLQFLCQQARKGVFEAGGPALVLVVGGGTETADHDQLAPGLDTRQAVVLLTPTQQR